MSIRDKIMKAAAAIEGPAVLLPSRWDRALVGYTIPEGTRLAVGVYDYGKAVGRPFLIDLDSEDALLDDLRTIEGEVKPIIIHTEGNCMSKAVILSIHPEWAEKIYSGEKEVEWRKTFPTEATPGMPVLLYETTPVCKVTGLFFWIGKETLIIREPDFDGQEIHPTAKRIIEAGCVPLDDLKKYQGAKGELFAWECRCKMKFHEPRPLSAYGLSRAPQSWQYITIKETQK